MRLFTFRKELGFRPLITIPMWSAKTWLLWVCWEMSKRAGRCCVLIPYQPIGAIGSHSLSLTTVGILNPADWIGLHFFNDDTCPTGHISPIQTGVSHSCTQPMNKQILYCPAVGTSSSSKLHQLWNDSNDELYGILDHSNQIEEPGFS